LAQKPVELEIPQAVLPNTVFKVVVRIPFDQKIKQVLSNGKAGTLNVGRVIILPDGFKISPENRIPSDIKSQVGKLYFQPYSEADKNIIVVGPIPGKNYREEIVFPILAPSDNINYLKYPIYLGGNRGRGQVYPDGSKSNNTVFTASHSGVIKEITPVDKKGGFQLLIEDKEGNKFTEIVPPGPELLVSLGQRIRVDEPLTNNPNVGGFGQAETEIVLQDPSRIQGLFVFFFVVLMTQIILVLKKKQFEKVQLAELNF